ncbi:MAG: UrcA family protein [Rhodobacteraceae bacterium]|nr:UrcA family protein [Paracoccaceae bacterium]
MFAISPRSLSLATVSLAATLGAAVLTTSFQASAFEPQSRSVAVQYADLDLTQKSDRDTLERRIKRAAEQACAPADSKAVQLHRIYANCLKDARANAERNFATVVAAAQKATNVAQATIDE